MSTTNVPREVRRSTRVQLKVVIEAKGVTEPLTCDGETIVVNRRTLAGVNGGCLNCGTFISASRGRAFIAKTT
jgi:hypothetical protein